MSITSSKEGETQESIDDYYTVLQCDRAATLDKLKMSYKKLALSLHPDKNRLTKEAFLRLQRAWSVLRDPQTRKQYDAELSCREHADCLLYDTISLSDMKRDQIEQVYSYPCRCGGNYFMELNDLVEQQIVIPCDNCSFHVQVSVS